MTKTPLTNNSSLRNKFNKNPNSPFLLLEVEAKAGHTTNQALVEVKIHHSSSSNTKTLIWGKKNSANSFNEINKTNSINNWFNTKHETERDYYSIRDYELLSAATKQNYCLISLEQFLNRIFLLFFLWDE